MDRNRAYYEQKESDEILREIKQKKKGDYYAILGLPRDCSADDVKRAFMKLSLKVHPDKNKSPEADQAFKIVSEAYQSLIEQRKFFSQRKTHTVWDMRPSFNWEEEEEKKKKKEEQESDSQPGRAEKPAPEKPVRSVRPDPQPVLRPGCAVRPGVRASAVLRRCESCRGYIYGKKCEMCEDSDDDGYDEYDEYNRYRSPY